MKRSPVEGWPGSGQQVRRDVTAPGTCRAWRAATWRREGTAVAVCTEAAGKALVPWG